MACMISGLHVLKLLSFLFAVPTLSDVTSLPALNLTRSQSYCACAAAYQAPVGTGINLKEVLLGETCSSTISLAAATKVFTVTATAFRQVLQDNPGLQQALFKDLSQQLTLSQATVQVTLLAAWNLPHMPLLCHSLLSSGALT